MEFRVFAGNRFDRGGDRRVASANPRHDAGPPVRLRCLFEDALAVGEDTDEVDQVGEEQVRV